MREKSLGSWAPLVYGALLAVLVLSGGGFALATFGAPASGSALAAPHATWVRSAPAAGTLHGDLVVTAANSPYVISPATTESSLYVQEGNITVASGGILLVQDETIEFLQFITSTGTLANRTSHVFTFDVQGSATFEDSSLITDTALLNSYQKLTMNVSGGGQLTLLNSTFEFPGWLTVTGATSSFVANDSIVRGTVLPSSFVENTSIVGDTIWAPVLSVTGGAHFTLDASSLLNTYADNVTQFGEPGPLPFTVSGAVISSGNGFSLNGFPYPIDSENLTRALSYSSFLGGSLQLFYHTNDTQTAAANSLKILGTTYPVGPITYANTSTTIEIPIPAAAINAINAAGPLGWLESSGAFDDPASSGWTLGATNGLYPVNITFQELSIIPDTVYNVTVSGAGTVLTAVDSDLDLNWNLTPGGPFPGTVPPTPWGSNKMLLTDGATAFIANVTVTHARTAVFWNDSAFLPDPSSLVYLYRWAEVPVEAAGNVPVVGAQLSAFYSYDASQSNNATATALNNLPAADPALAAYAAAWDAQNGIAGYGQTDAAGNGFLLLADTALQQPTLPDGVFLGGYHIGVRLAGVAGSAGVLWGYAALTAYPSGMTPAFPDSAQPVIYSNYVPAVSIGTVTVLVNGGAEESPSIALGSTLSLQVEIESTGSAPVDAIATTLYYANNSTGIASGAPIFDLVAGAESVTNLTWVVNQSVVGLHGTFNATFTVSAVWNTGSGPTGGSVNVPVFVQITPSPISFEFVPPSGTLTVGTTYFGSGTIDFNGSGDAYVNVTAIAPNGQQFILGTVATPPGAIGVEMAPTADMPSGVYTVVATAWFNNVTAKVTTPNAFTLSNGAAPSTNPLDQKYGPFTLLQWIIIAAAGVAAVLIGLFLLRRSARGKLVECGECGTPIPESATVCPKCGAEFETDIVRCSRCGSTIPANSEVCPECAAQLLGSPDAEKNDPERQGYNDLVDRHRNEAKRELGDNYNEGAFWDWWKRQTSYVPFSQWKLQQSGGPRAGMGAPPAENLSAEPAAPTTTTAPPKRPGSPGAAAPPAATPASARAAAPAARPVTPAPAPAVTPAAAPAASAATAGMKPCANCGKEIPPDYLVCPFCGAVTQ